MDHTAFEVGECAFQQRWTGCAFGVTGAVESIQILRRKPTGEVFLIV